MNWLLRAVRHWRPSLMYSKTITVSPFLYIVSLKSLTLLENSLLFLRLLLHQAMGNFFFRVMDQHVTDPEEVFQNVFMVGADARTDLFSNEYNPAAVGDGRGDGFEISRELLQVDTIEDEILPIPNGGYAITKITNKVHVVWNNDDDALAI